MFWISITLLALGFLFVLGFVFFILRKKGKFTFRFCLIVTSAIFFIGGGVTLSQQLQKQAENTRQLYLGIRYLEDDAYDLAALHLTHADEEVSGKIPLLGAQSLLETLRGNTTVAELKYSLLSACGKGAEEICRCLQTMDAGNIEQKQVIINLLLDQLSLSQDDQEKLEAAYLAEAGTMGQDVVPTDWTVYAEQYGGEQATFLQLNEYIYQNSWGEALQTAADAVNEAPTSQNRLLLAEIVAESTYAGYSIDDNCFEDFSQEKKSTRVRTTDRTSDENQSSAEKERESLEKEYESLQQELARLEMLLLSAQERNDEEEISQLTAQKEEIYNRADEAQRRSDCLYAYRALNSIADLNSLEAKVVRARIYFAIQDYDAAIQCIDDAASSPQALFSSNTKLTSALKMVQKAAQGEAGVIQDTDEFRDALQFMMTSAFPEISSLSFTPLTQDFVSRVISDQKYLSYPLAVSEIDVSEYPTVSVTVTGQEDAVRSFTEDAENVVHDTRTTVDWNAELLGDFRGDVCCVVDLSGSMDGEPLENARSALAEFVRSSENIQISLVGFADTASVYHSLTTDKASLLSQIEIMGNGGGTDITSGIEMGTQTLEGAYGGFMLLMTDGQSDIDMSVVDRAVEAGITIHTIGFGDVNDSLLQQIADVSGGQYVRADSSEELSSVYGSLQGMLGSKAKIRYTVTENSDETERYVYLQTSKYGSSAYRAYTIDAQAEEKEAAGNSPVLLSVQPQTYSSREIEQAVRWGDTLSIRLVGEGFDQISALYFGGNQVDLQENGENYLFLKLPFSSLSAGLYDIEIETVEGKRIVWKNRFAVGEEVEYRQVKAGDLSFEMSRVLTLPDGRAVGDDSTVSDGSSLYLEIPGLLVFSPSDGSENEDGTFTLKEGALLEGNGPVTVQDNDAAWAQDAPEFLVNQDSFEIFASTGKSHLTIKQEENTDE